MAKKHILPELGGIRLQQLQTSQLQEFYNRKYKEGRLDGKGGLSSRAIHMMHRIISGAFKQALQEGKVQRDVTNAVKLPPLKYKEMQTLTAEQVGRFLQAAKEHRLYPAFELELGTGLRRGELLALRWRDVDLDKGTITVRRSLLRVRVSEKKTELRFTEPKTEKGKRTIPIPKRVISILAAYKKQVIVDAWKLGQKFQEDWLLFSVPFNRPIDPDNFGKQYARLLKKAGIPHRAFHNLRHTVATILLERGEHPKIVQELLGHARVGITLDIYSHVDGDLMQRAASKLDEALREAEEKAQQSKKGN